MQTIKVYNLEGKDYFCELEAAHYMCFGRTKFLEVMKIEGVRPIDLHGRLVYRRIDLKRIIESMND